LTITSSILGYFQTVKKAWTSLGKNWCEKGKNNLKGTRQMGLLGTAG
jgi:hypothetical protein